MHRNAFGGRAPPGPTGELKRSPRPPIAAKRGPTSKGRGREGKGEWRGEKRKEKEGRKRGSGGEGKGEGRGGRRRGEEGKGALLISGQRGRFP